MKSICKIQLAVVFTIISSVVSAQQVIDSSSTVVIKELVSNLTPYGSIRIGAGFAEEGEIGISNNAPRVGLKMKHPLSAKEGNNFNIIGRIELGLNLTSRDETVEFSADPGAGITQVGDAVFTRIGYLGVTYKGAEFTFGKQNSIYYSLGASEVDRSLAFGGNAIGVWNISDGGVSGTGRANQALQLKYEIKGLTLGAQAQVRNISSNNESIDTYGLGAHYKLKKFGIGVGYNKVIDGVDNPLPNQAKKGDEAIVASASYELQRFLVAASYSFSTNHHRTGSFYYDATGIEFYTRYKFDKNKKWHVGIGVNYLKPEPNQGLGDFDTKFGILELAYNFKKSSHIFISTKQDFSFNAFGDRRNQSVYGLGIKFSF